MIHCAYSSGLPSSPETAPHVVEQARGARAYVGGDGGEDGDEHVRIPGGQREERT
jgi:hypothetical protein